MDQILFIIDLDQLIPLEGPSVDEESQENRLVQVKQACQRILLGSCDLTNLGEAALRNVPFFGFRFYSSTGYFTVPEQLTGQFHEFSLQNFELFEAAFNERFDPIVQHTIKEVKRDPQHFTKHKTNGKRSECESLRRCLEDVALLYDWDRPFLHSPVKKGGDSEPRLGNAVLLLTRLPTSDEELAIFMNGANASGKATRSVSFRDLSEGFLSKKVKAALCGELNISLHVLDMIVLHGHGHQPSARVQNAFARVLKEVKGAVIPFNVVSETRFSRQQSADSQVPHPSQSADQHSGDPANSASAILRQRCRTVGRQPLSAVMLTHLREVRQPWRPHNQDRAYSACPLTLGTDSHPLLLETYSGALDRRWRLDEGLTTVGLVPRTLVDWRVTRAASCLSIWSEDGRLGSLVRHWRMSGRCLVVQSSATDQLALIDPDAGSGQVTLRLLDRTDSNAFSCMLKLNRFKAEPVHLPAIDTTRLVTDLAKNPPNRRPEPGLSAIRQMGLDIDSLEPWRLPDGLGNATRQLMEQRMLHLMPKQKAKVRMMNRLQEAYRRTRGPKTLRPVMRKNSEPVLEDLRLGGFSEVIGGGGRNRGRALEKHSSGMSLESAASSTATRSSGGISAAESRTLSRGAVLKKLGQQTELSRKISTTSSASSLALSDAGRSSAKDTFLHIKSKKANEFLQQLQEAGQHLETQGVADLLCGLREELVCQGADSQELAGLAEACVTFLLRHLETTSSNKSTLEELIASWLLLDVGSISRISEQPVRSRHHIFQILLRCEVHWLLPNSEKTEEYEASILLHLRQISLYDSPQKMLAFMEGVLVESYLERQPDLLATIYDELDQQRPPQLSQLFSPTGMSVAPSSNNSHSSIISQPSLPPQQPAAALGGRQRRHLLANRPRSFDAGLAARQINITAGGPTRRAVKAGVRPLSAKKRAAAMAGATRSAAALSAHKSPRKNIQQARRNLRFEKSPRKNPLTPAKNPKTTPMKLTPGKKHRMIAPETPAAKLNRRKSDGNRSILETPDKGAASSSLPSLLSGSLGTTANNQQFYSGVRSRNVQKFEESQSALQFAGFGPTASLLRSDSGGVLNRSVQLFPHLVAAKRKRESIVAADYDDQPSAKHRRIDFGSGDVGSADMVVNSGAPVGSRTPAKRLASEAWQELVSPNKRVQFNMRPMPPTPGRHSHTGGGGPSAVTPKRSILKTPLKTGLCSPLRSDGGEPSATTTATTPLKASIRLATPVRLNTDRLALLKSPKGREILSSALQQSPTASGHHQSPSQNLFRTPLKSPRRRDLTGSSPRRLVGLPETPEQLMSQPSSPILSSNKKRRSSGDRSRQSPASVLVALLANTNREQASRVQCDLDNRKSAASPARQDELCRPLPISPGDMTTLPLHSSCNATTLTLRSPGDMTTLPLRSPCSGDEVDSTANDQTTMFYSKEPPPSSQLMVMASIRNGEISSKRPPPTSKGLRNLRGGVLYGLSPPTHSLGQRRAPLATLTAQTDDLLEFEPQFVSTIEESSLSALLSAVQPHLPSGRLEEDSADGDSDYQRPPFGTPTKVDTFASNLCLELVSPGKGAPAGPISRTISENMESAVNRGNAKPVVSMTASARQGKMKARKETSPDPDDELITRDSPTNFKAGKSEKKRKKELGATLDDRLTAYYSPSTAKRQSKQRLDIDISEQLIEQAIQAISHKKKKHKTSQAGTFLADNEPRMGDNDDDNISKAHEVESKPVAVPKELAGLNDLLSDYFSPKDGSSRRRESKATSFNPPKTHRVQPPIDSIKTPRREQTTAGGNRKRKLQVQPQDNAIHDDCPSVSASCLSPVKSRLIGNDYECRQQDEEDAGGMLRSPDNGQESGDVHLERLTDTPGRRSERRAKAAAISYADIDDFDSADDDEEEEGVASRVELVVAAKEVEEERRVLARRQLQTPSKATAPRRRTGAASAAVLSPSVKQHFRERKRGSGDTQSRKCLLKVQNLSSEIRDIDSDRSQSVSSLQSLNPNYLEAEAVLDRLSPGTAATAQGKYFSVVERTESPAGTIKLKLNRIVKRRQSCVDATVSRSLLALQRFSRSQTKDLGISPQKLIQIMAPSPPPKVARGMGDAADKENQLQKTPRLRLKRVKSEYGPTKDRDEERPGMGDQWKSETIFSPEKRVLPGPTTRVILSPTKLPAYASRGGLLSPDQTAVSGPKGGRGSLSTFSPLSSSSIHKLTTSPIIATQVASKPRKRVNKQLYT